MRHLKYEMKKILDNTAFAILRSCAVVSIGSWVTDFTGHVFKELAVQKDCLISEDGTNMLS